MGAGLTGDPATLESPGSPTIAVMADDLLSADSSRLIAERQFLAESKVTSIASGAYLVRARRRNLQCEGAAADAKR